MVFVRMSVFIYTLFDHRRGPFIYSISPQVVHRKLNKAISQAIIMWVDYPHKFLFDLWPTFTLSGG